MTQEKENEFELMRVIKEESFEEIERKLKPSALKYCESNTLVMGMKVRVFCFVFVFPFFCSRIKASSMCVSTRPSKRVNIA